MRSGFLERKLAQCRLGRSSIRWTLLRVLQRGRANIGTGAMATIKVAGEGWRGRRAGEAG